MAKRPEDCKNLIIRSYEEDVVEVIYKQIEKLEKLMAQAEKQNDIAKKSQITKSLIYITGFMHIEISKHLEG